MSVCQRRNTELLIQIDARKASWSGTKVCEITALEIVFTAHCHLSQLLEPRSSKWGNGSRSGGGRNNKRTTWQRRPSTVAEAPATHFALGPDVFKEGTFLTSWEWDEVFFSTYVKHIYWLCKWKVVLFLHCTSVQPDSRFWCLNSACFSSQVQKLSQRAK